MASILSTADFTGEFNIPVGQYTSADLELFIAQVQEDYLTNLLGYDLKVAFEAGIAVTPPHDVLQKWQDLRDGATYNDGGSHTVYFKGLKEMLKYFTYYEYMRYSEIQNTKIGQRKNDGTNSTPAEGIGKMKIRRMYNKGLDIYYDATYFITDKNSPTEVYALFLYTPKKKIGLL